MCITKARAIELVKAEIGLYACDSIRAIQENVIDNQIQQIDKKDEQIGDYIHKVDVLRDMSTKQDLIINRQQDQLESCDKEVKKQKFKVWLVTGLGTLVEVATIYFLNK